MATRVVRMLFVLPLLTGCISRSTGLKQGDTAAEAGQWDRALEHYKDVLENSVDEEWEKDRAERGYVKAWKRTRATARGKLDEELTELEGRPLSDVDRAAALQALAEKAKGLNASPATYAHFARVRARLAPGAWQAVDKLGEEGRHVEAEALGVRLSTLPGASREDQEHLASVRSRARARYEALRGSRPAHSPTAAIYGALAQHFAGQRVTTPETKGAEWLAGYDVSFDGPPECAEVAEWVRARLPRDGATRVKAQLSLRECRRQQAVRTVAESSVIGEVVQTGVDKKTVVVTENECTPHYETRTDQRQQVLYQGGGASPTGAIKWVEKTTVVTNKCGPVEKRQVIETPIYEIVRKQAPYAHDFRTITTSLKGMLRLSTGSSDAIERPLSYGLQQEDERFERYVLGADGQNHLEGKAFENNTADSLFAGHEQQTVEFVQALAAPLLQARAEAMRVEAASARGDDRSDLLVRAASLGSVHARSELAAWRPHRELPGSAEQEALLRGQDPFAQAPSTWTAPTGDESGEEPTTIPRAKGFPGYKSGFRYEFLGGALLVGPLKNGTPQAGAPDGETAASVGARIEFPLLGILTERGHGFTAVDSAALDAHAAIRTSSAPPPEDAGANRFGYRLGAAYTALLGARIGPVGVLAGARIEADMSRTGEIALQGGFSLPLCARLEYRIIEFMMPRVSACAFSLAGRDRITGELTIPVQRGKEGGHIFGRFDRLQTGVDLGLFSGAGFADTETTLNTFTLGLGLGL